MSEAALAVRVLIALVFFTAAVGKLRNPLVFQGVVANYRLLPELAVAPFSMMLPLGESVLCAGLLFSASLWPIAGSAALLLLFAAAMTVNLLRGRRHIDCGCFQGSFRQQLSWVFVVRNVLLALVLLAPARVPVGTLIVPGAAESVLTGIALFALLQSMNILWSVVPAWRQHRAVIAGAKQ